ncbi:MAG: aminotransferase class I/II-fold pyridoxal phosphate-dependent enzyme [Rhodospirillaceae bacterium]|jgi:aspartate/methionine/tyrosine aminotransferase|nr:aminotransferase class I/II-fold pyridoxal phosphate-dependent enzyme [Rhodospirillaceae bacterium]MBT5566652.1 aminotransferase class I/II-fold pyridoxal phosphate-dependent enzyme [Rhodospirillaceae bacterium]MBT6087982.1 aminotransferase class I/II-fold pyridoxal phosphate-dependent enzyme [Rhodospirillaceae bacterium]
MVLKASERGKIPPFIVMDVMKAASALEMDGREIVHLEVGQPDTGLPMNAVEPVRKLIGEAALGYTIANGIFELRERIVGHYKVNYGVQVDAESIFITTGSSAGFQLAFLSAFDPGDRVALASPGYPAYRHILTSLGLDPVLLQVGNETRFQPTVALLESLETPVDGLILASPSNPTGTILPREEFENIIEHCRSRGIRVVSDEIYHGISYGADVTTAASSGAPEIVVNSFSKYFSMTGWRIGWLVVPPDLARSVECLAQNHYISPPTISQWAAVHVFDCLDELEGNVLRYQKNRELLLKGLPLAGIDKMAPSDGAFYLYADVSEFTDNSIAYCQSLLDQVGVAITPGVDFDPLNGHQTVRISFAGSTENIEDAVKKITAWQKSVGV